MANEFKHKSVSTDLSQAEWDDTAGHVFNSQATGDLMYASSSTQLTRLAIGSTGQALAVASSLPTWSTPTRDRIPFKSGTRWLTPGWDPGAYSGNVAVAANRLYYTPIWVGEALSVIRIGLEVGTGASSSLIRLGIYNWDLDDDNPGALVVDGGTVDSSSSGDKEVTISVTLGPDKGYFLAVVSDSNPTLKKLGSPIKIAFQAVSTTNGGTQRDIIGFINSQGAQVSGGLSDPAVGINGITHTDYQFSMLRDA
jgi:hypothetical protein